MSNYNLGDEIYREMIRQGMRPDEFGDAICRSRQTTYDIFKKRYLSTDLLTDICKVLNRDFFSELARECLTDRTSTADDDDDEIAEMVWNLSPADKLHCFRPNFRLESMMLEYVSSPRRKPLVLFCSPAMLNDRHYNLPRQAEQLFIKDNGQPYMDHKPDFRKHTPGMTVSNLRLDGREKPITTIVADTFSYIAAIEQAIKMMETGGHVIVYLPVTNELSFGQHGGLVMEDVSDDLFIVWHDKVHCALVAGTAQQMRRQYYRAFRRTGIIDKLIDDLNQNRDVTMELFDLIYGSKILDVEEIMPQDSTGLSRIKVFYRGSDCLSIHMENLLFYNDINNHPRLSFWIDVRNGVLIDFEYNKRTQE